MNRYGMKSSCDALASLAKRGSPVMIAQIDGEPAGLSPLGQATSPATASAQPAAVISFAAGERRGFAWHA